MSKINMIITKRLAIFKVIVKFLLWIPVLFGLYSYYRLHEYEKTLPARQIFISVGSSPPENYIVYTNMYNTVINFVYLGLLLVIIYFVLDYYSDKEHHFFTYILKAVNKLEKDKEGENGEGTINKEN